MSNSKDNIWLYDDHGLVDDSMKITHSWEGDKAYYYTEETFANWDESQVENVISMGKNLHMYMYIINIHFQ